MAKPNDPPRKKIRITDEQLTEIKRLFRQGVPITEIARRIGCHRQTVRMHLKEQHGDIVADEVRKQVLTQELRGHYQQLVQFARVELRRRLDASVPEYDRPGEQPVEQPISTSGLLGLPYPGSARYMTGEWQRMYLPHPIHRHLLKSLRDHTSDSTMWVYWDRWRKLVSPYESAGRDMWIWLDERLEAGIPDRIDPARFEPVRSWLFGNILRVAEGGDPDDLDTFRRNVIDPEGMIIGRDPDKDIDGSQALHAYLSGIMDEARTRPEWEVLRSATEILRDKPSQLEFRRIARDIDYALVGVELRTAFPGRCELCPV